MQRRMLKSVSHWSHFLLVISSGCRVLLLSLHIRVSSAGSGGNKVHSSPFIWFAQQTLVVFLLELGLDQWAVNLRRVSLSSIAFPQGVSLSLSLSLSATYPRLSDWCQPFTASTQPLLTLLHANVSRDHYDVKYLEKGLGHKSWMLNNWFTEFTVDSSVWLLQLFGGLCIFMYLYFDR